MRLSFYFICFFRLYSSSNLSYCCLNLSSHCIYISCHVCFHEHYFPFIKSNQVLHTSSSISTPTLTINLSSLTTFPILKIVAPRSSLTSPSVSLSPPTSLSLDHSQGSGYVVPASSPSDSPIFVASLTLLLGASSPTNTFAQSTSCLDLVVDFSSYSLPQQFMSVSSDVLLAPWKHHMVLRAWQNKFANLSLVSDG
jgi:hypothetical protein